MGIESGPKFGKIPSEENFDLEIKTQEELEEAKKIAGFTTHEKIIDGMEAKNKEDNEENGVENLEAYIQLHKEIILPISEITDSWLKMDIEHHGGHFDGRRIREGDKKFESTIRYIDKDSNIAQVEIELAKINSIKAEIEKISKEPFNHSLREGLINLIDMQLKELGFINDTKFIGDSMKKWYKIDDLLKERADGLKRAEEIEIKKQSTAKKREKFNF